MGITGITNGCFDPIHVGHIFNLANCKRKVDTLIVCLNSDTSIRKLKGERRPYQTEHERKFALHSLRYVDNVIIFDTEEQLEMIIWKHRPQFLFKGMDYHGKKITGQDIVEKDKGKVELIPLYRDWSSSKLIDLLIQMKELK